MTKKISHPKKTKSFIHQLNLVVFGSNRKSSENLMSLTFSIIGKHLIDFFTRLFNAKIFGETYLIFVQREEHPLVLPDLYQVLQIFNKN